MKVGILTFHYANNYGAVLQAYGLYKAVEAMGHDVQIIDYRPLAARRFYNRHLSKRHPIQSLQTLLYQRRFNQFRKRYLPLSRTYLTVEDLEQSPPQLDYIICGSDQIWNVSSIRGFDPAFFLSFLKGSTPKRISYAATFGNAEDLGSNKNEIASLLTQFDHISVRDVKTQTMITELIRRPSTHVLDPCFLTNYGIITPPRVIPHHYILFYSRIKNKFLTQVVQYLQRKLQLPIFSIDLSIDGTTRLQPSPLGWISLMQYADYVITDSFHGTCFSIINQKQFVTIPYQGGMSRIEDILMTAGLSERIASNYDELANALEVDIEYKIISERIEDARKKSFSFLSNALE